EKILYRITDKGNESLKEWLKEEQANNDLKYETLLKLYFGGVEEREVTLHNIELFEEETRRSLSVLRIYRDNLEKVLYDGDHLNYYLTVTFGIDTYEAYLKWCTKAKKILRERGVHPEK
nr:PadR family transcriptional regulator [Lachnospiraceae bacterium]